MGRTGERTTTTTSRTPVHATDRAFTQPEAQGPVSTKSCMGRGAAGTHASWQKGARAYHGWASVPPTASQTIAASSVDAAWGSGHHQETHMWGTKSLPSPHATNYHAVAYEPTRRRTTCACHTRDQTHTHQWGEGARGGEWGGRGREHAASRVGHQHMGKSRVCSQKSGWGCEV